MRGPVPRPLKERFEEKVIKSDDLEKCWDWKGGRAKFGYGTIRINRRLTMHAHRAAWLLYCGPIANSKIFVLHKCDNPICTNPNHLFLGTNADNMADMTMKGRQRPCRGEKAGQHILTNKDVLNIRRDKRSSLVLAKIYGVTKATIVRARNGRTWGHLPHAMPIADRYQRGKSQ